MAFIKPYYDQDHTKERSEQTYGRIKSLELFEKGLNKTAVDYRPHNSQPLARQNVMDQLDHALLYPKEAQSFSTKMWGKFKKIKDIFGGIFHGLK
jgi:hypothetical protein